MQPSSSHTIERLLQEHVLPLFSFPDGKVTWQGESELTLQSYAYYFCITDENYLLVAEAFHGAGDNALKDLLIGNAVAPHQKISPVLPKEGTRAYVTLANKTVPRLTGDFSLFRIVG